MASSAPLDRRRREIEQRAYRGKRQQRAWAGRCKNQSGIKGGVSIVAGGAVGEMSDVVLGSYPSLNERNAGRENIRQNGEAYGSGEK